MNEPLRDPAPDPELRQALASLEPAPIDEVDWALLRGAIRDRAALPLAQRRRAQRTSPAWRRPLVPMAAAAGLALIVSTQLFRPATTGDVAGTDAQTGFRPVVEEVLGAQISESELDLLFGQVSADMLVVAAVGQP